MPVRRVSKQVVWYATVLSFVVGCDLMACEERADGFTVTAAQDGRVNSTAPAPTPHPSPQGFSESLAQAIDELLAPSGQSPDASTLTAIQAGALNSLDPTPYFSQKGFSDFLGDAIDELVKGTRRDSESTATQASALNSPGPTPYLSQKGFSDFLGDAIDELFEGMHRESERNNAERAAIEALPSTTPH